MDVYVIGKGPRVKPRLCAAKADVDEFLADPLQVVQQVIPLQNCNIWYNLALSNRVQRCLAPLVRAEVDEAQQQPLAAAGAFLGH